jgi:hypothetical protein
VLTFAAYHAKTHWGKVSGDSTGPQELAKPAVTFGHHTLYCAAADDVQSPRAKKSEMEQKTRRDPLGIFSLLFEAPAAAPGFVRNRIAFLVCEPLVAQISPQASRTSVYVLDANI